MRRSEYFRHRFVSTPHRKGGPLWMIQAVPRDRDYAKETVRLPFWMMVVGSGEHK